MKNKVYLVKKIFSFNFCFDFFFGFTFAAFLVIGLSFGSKAFAWLDIYTVFDAGSVLMNEKAQDKDYVNKSTMLVGHWGYSLGARAKLNGPNFGIGFVGEVSWIGDTSERQLSEGGDFFRYRNEFSRSLAGLNVSLNTGASSTLFEYYPLVQNTVSYSDNASENPFRKGDVLRGTGYGFGFNFGVTNGFGFQMLYKKLQIKELEISGTKITLPDDRFLSFGVDEFSLGFLIRY